MVLHVNNFLHAIHAIQKSFRPNSKKSSTRPMGSFWSMAGMNPSVPQQYLVAFPIVDLACGKYRHKLWV